MEQWNKSVALALFRDYDYENSYRYFILYRKQEA